MTSPLRRRARRGFSLAEVLVTIVILGIIAAAFTRLLATQSTMFSYTTKSRNARSIARNSMNILLSDLRMVNAGSSAPGSVEAATADGKDITVRVPYWFGLICSATGVQMTVSMLPVDSATVAQSVFSGYAWRRRNASPPRFGFVTAAGVPALSGVPTVCTGNLAGQAQIRTMTLNGRTSQIYDLTPGDANARAGDPVFFYERVRYRFAPSAAYTGKLGLYRQVASGANEEIMAPFDTSARFRYYQAPFATTATDTSQIAPPVSLDSIRGFELVLNGLPPDFAGTSNAATTNVTTKMTTSVFFKNRSAF